MNRFFYYFMLAALLLVVVYWFIDGRPTTEGYGWLLAAWVVITGGAYVWDKAHGKKI